MDDKKQTCENCRYFVRYYFKKDKSFMPTIKGHCINGKTKQLTVFKTCENWESIEIRKAERKRNIITTIEEMQKTLSEIAEILKSE